MKLIDLTCSKCGATLQVNPELSKCMCQYCGNEMLVDDETVHHQVDNGFEIGYQAELGRQQAIQDLVNQREVERQNAIIADRQRLLNTPKGFQYWNMFNRSAGRNLSDIEVEPYIRNCLANDAQLQYEYQNSIAFTKEIYEEESRRKIYATKIIVITCTVLFIFAFVLYGIQVRHYIKNPPIMPNVSAMEYYDARTAIQDTSTLQLNINKEEEFSDTVAKGKVIRTNPDVGSQLSYQDEIVVFVSKGPEPQDSINTESSKEFITDELYELTISFVTTPEFSYEVENAENDNTNIEVFTSKDIDGTTLYWAKIPAGIYKVEFDNYKKTYGIDHLAIIDICKNTNDDNYTEYRLLDDKCTLKGIDPDNEFLNEVTVNIDNDEIVWLDTTASGKVKTIWHKLK